MSGNCYHPRWANRRGSEWGLGAGRMQTPSVRLVVTVLSFALFLAGPAYAEQWVTTIAPDGTPLSAFEAGGPDDLVVTDIARVADGSLWVTRAFREPGADAVKFTAAGQ